MIELEPTSAPPEIEPAELERGGLTRLVDDGDVQAIEAALQTRRVRLPDVLDELDRVLGLGHGNLGAVLATMLIARFHVARADRLAEAVLTRERSAGLEELVDLAASLLGQERLSVASRVLDVALARNPAHGRALYLRARVLARRGHTREAFEVITRVSPKLLEPAGLAVAARYAALAGRDDAADRLLGLAHSSAPGAADADVALRVREVERIRARAAQAPGLAANLSSDLRAAFAVEYGSLVVELAADAKDGGRFGLEPITLADTGRLVAKLARAVEAAKLPLEELLFATEDGEIVAAALSKVTGARVREWRADRSVSDGAWLLMASAATHPHLPSPAVAALQRALDEGVLRTMALVLPAGWRGPLVPDVIGRVTTDDELPWALDDEVDETVERIFEDSAPSGLARDDDAALFGHVAASRALLRAAPPEPRDGHAPYFDESPVPRG